MFGTHNLARDHYDPSSNIDCIVVETLETLETPETLENLKILRKGEANTEMA